MYAPLLFHLYIIVLCVLLTITTPFCTHTQLLQQPLRMRVRIGYVINGTSVQEQGEINNFPPQMLQ